MQMNACVWAGPYTGPGKVIAAHGLPGCPGSLWLPAKPSADYCLCPGLPAASPKVQYVPGLGECKETARSCYLRLLASGGWVRHATRQREPWVLLAGPLAAHVVTAPPTHQPMQRSPEAWTHFHFKLWVEGYGLKGSQAAPLKLVITLLLDLCIPGHRWIRRAGGPPVWEAKKAAFLLSAQHPRVFSRHLTHTVLPTQPSWDLQQSNKPKANGQP